MKYRKFIIVVLVAVSALAYRPAAAQEAADTTPGLTGKEWKIKEIRFLQNNTPYHYKQDDAFESNVTFDNDYLKFNKDGTGVYHMSDGTPYKLAWKFVNAEKTSIDYRIENSRYDQPSVIHWEHISIKNNEMYYTEYYTNKSGIHSLGYGVRVSR